MNQQLFGHMCNQNGHSLEPLYRDYFQLTLWQWDYGWTIKNDFMI